MIFFHHFCDNFFHHFYDSILSTFRYFYIGNWCINEICCWQHLARLCMSGLYWITWISLSVNKEGRTGKNTLRMKVILKATMAVRYILRPNMLPYKSTSCFASFFFFIFFFYLLLKCLHWFFGSDVLSMMCWGLSWSRIVKLPLLIQVSWRPRSISRATSKISIMESNERDVIRT